LNSREAMPRGGKLTIKTSNVQLDDEYASTHGDVKSGLYVMLTVSDTGSGMDEETRSRIFEPFFTTKEKGKGTGLGLSTVYGIVKQSGGNVIVHSEPEQGTVFTIYLPKSDEKVMSDEPAHQRRESFRGSETILVVEDEQSLRKLISRVLKAGGYKVLQAQHGNEALHISKEYKKPIAILVTDVVMPKIGGRELAQCLEESRPEMKVLYISGYTDDTVIHQGVLKEGMPFIQKPFTAQVLLKKVRGILDRKISPKHGACQIECTSIKFE